MTTRLGPETPPQVRASGGAIDLLRGRYRESTAILRGRPVVSADRRCGIGARAGAGEKNDQIPGAAGVPDADFGCLLIVHCMYLHVSTCNGCNGCNGCAVVDTSM